MRTSIAVAAGLIVVNLALLDDDPPTPPPPSFEPLTLAMPTTRTVADTAPPAVCRPPDEFADLGHETLALAKAWRTRHGCEPLPAECTHPDPIAILFADVDSTGDFEKVYGNRRFGVAMFTSKGELLATMDPVGCGSWPASVAGDQSLSVSTLHVASTPHSQVIVRTRTLGHCGEMLAATIVERRDRDLVTLAELDMAGDRGCMWESQVVAKLAPGHNGELKVHYHGRARDHGQPWYPIDEHCLLHQGKDGRLRPVDDISKQLCPQSD